MNTELINQLKSQCIVREQRGTNAFNSYMVDKFDTEKFTQLIVRECAEVGSCGHGHHDSELIKRAVLQHFGVEE
jgi:hypothetical protein